MKVEEFARLAMDNHNFMCYIVDMDTYELLYINETARMTFTPFSEQFIPGKTCYHFLHGFDSPCDICNNHLLHEGKKLYTEIQNIRNAKYYSHIDMQLTINGKKLKITYAYDASEQKNEIVSLTRKITTEETLIKCIQILSEDNDLDSSIMDLLGIVCDYYNADRAYLFECDQEKMTARNTYEYSVHPDLATIDTNPILDSEMLSPIMKAFEKDGEMTILDVENELDHSSALYRIFHETNVYSIQLVPIRMNNKLTYFMGVDNPRESTKDLSLLHSVIVFVADSIKKNKVVRQLEELSYTDILTGLSNRNKYLERLESLELRNLSSLGFVHVNINALKKTNELYGEVYGDSILKRVAELLNQYIIIDLFRVSGDEFIGLCQNMPQEKFEKLISDLREENNKHEDFSFAVGGVWQDKKIDIRQGLTQASDIMYSEKQRFYREQTTEKQQTRLNPVEILLNEIRSNQFTIFLQPKVDIFTGEIVSAEALVRKFGADGKMVSPDRFIPIYENENTIRHLDFFVLEEVCALLETLIEEDRALPIAVNFSRVSCLAYDVIDEIVNICARYNVPHKYIKIELTESIEKMDFDFYHKKIAILKEHGFDISLDDFGAKHSNLLMLTMAEFSEVKIDKGLIDYITTSAENRTVVRNIIKTVKELGKSSCVAEGIETQEQMILLQDFGCDYGQGYYFYRPMPVSDFLNIYGKKTMHFSTEVKMVGSYSKHNFVVNYDELYSAIEAMPLCMNLWNHKRENIMCNEHAAQLFELGSKAEYLERFAELSPEIQPDGRHSGEAAIAYINEARNTGYSKFNWMHCKLNGEEIPTEVILVKLDVKSEDGDFLVAGYTRDLRSQIAGTEEENSATAYFFNEISDKTLFNTISEIAAEFFWAYSNKTKTIQFFGKGVEILNLPPIKLDFPSAIYEKNIVPDNFSDVFMDFTRAMEEGRHLPIEVEFNLPEGGVKFFRIDYRTIFDSHNKPIFSIGKTAVIADSAADYNKK